jgi:DNA polymerase-3 subunit epsilon
MSRQIVLDTETTGLEIKDGHRMIEIGCVEMQNRRLTGSTLHYYLQPDRAVDPGAYEVHGISNQDLEGKPRFPEIMDELFAYLDGAELIIHNAPFDVGYIEHEYRLAERPVTLSDNCVVTDTLRMARQQFPGQRNNLDALCKRLGVSNGHRTLHGALLDSEILADVYLRMTGGQTALGLDERSAGEQVKSLAALNIDVAALPLIQADSASLAAHDAWMERLDKADNGNAWRRHADLD